MINAPYYVVVASSDEAIGTVIEAGPRVHQLQTGGTLLLPVDPGIATSTGSSAACAFQLAQYGRGIEWPAGGFTRGCPLNVYLPTGSVRVCWMFEVTTRAPRIHMNIALAGDATERGVADVQHEPGYATSGFSPDGGVVSGTSIVRGAPRSFATVCLGGVSHDPARVLWLAATVLPL